MACVQNIANPISLAHKVMTDTPHCMLAGEGALKFARKIGFPILKDASVFVSDRSHQMYLKKKCKHGIESGTTADPHVARKNKDVSSEEHDTVGAVAMDTNGYIAVSSSTGKLHSCLFLEGTSFLTKILLFPVF